MFHSILRPYSSGDTKIWCVYSSLPCMFHPSLSQTWIEQKPSLAENTDSDVYFQTNSIDEKYLASVNTEDKTNPPTADASHRNEKKRSSQKKKLRSSYNNLTASYLWINEKKTNNYDRMPVRMYISFTYHTRGWARGYWFAHHHHHYHCSCQLPTARARLDCLISFSTVSLARSRACTAACVAGVERAYILAVYLSKGE